MADVFITGSRAYGTPREDSDLDLVVLTDMESITEMAKLSDNADANVCFSGSGLFDGASLRFGKLNLLCFLEQDQFDAWQQTTIELAARRPVTREEAIAALDVAEAAVIASRASQVA
jgi:hypothetical protein